MAGSPGPGSGKLSQIGWPNASRKAVWAVARPDWPPHPQRVELEDSCKGTPAGLYNTPSLRAAVFASIADIFPVKRGRSHRNGYRSSNFTTSLLGRCRHKGI